MSYFAQGIQQGGEIGARAYLEKKKRDQDSELAKARLTFEADQLRENFKGQGTLQDKRLLADAEQEKLKQGFTIGRDATLNNYDTAKLDKTQAFTAGRDATLNNYDTAKLDKTQAFTADQGEKNRSAAEKADAARLFLEAQRLRQAGAQFDVTKTWAQSPLNPQNQASTANADYTRSRIDKDDPINAGSPVVGGKLRPEVGDKAIQNGVTYTWDGKKWK